MELHAVAAVVVGVFAILVRAPLLVWPAATLRAYRALLASNGRLRALGASIGALGVFVATATHGVHGAAVRVVEVVGWVLAGGGAFLIGFPNAYRRFADATLDAVADPAALRAIGALGAAIGAVFVWLGLETG